MESKTLQALFPAPRRGILRAAFSDTKRWWSLEELAAEGGANGAGPEVKQLTASGILRENRHGSNAVYQADPECPLFPELQGIFAKTADRSDRPTTILVVEDQPATAQITRILLQSWNYKVVEAHGGKEAIERFRAHQDEIGLLLTDVIMPDMSGPDLADHLRKIKRSLRVVFMSGYPKDEKIPPEAEFLAKPFNPDRLARVVRRQLEQL